MNKKGLAWYLILGIFYLGLGLLAFSFYTQVEDIRLFNEGVELDAEFEGNDWVSWEDTDRGVVATRVHPLPFQKPFDRPRVRKGDRLRKLDYLDVKKAEVADEISRSSQPGIPISVVLERTDPYNLSVEQIAGFIPNGFRLTFSFNDFTAYWHMFGWIVALGAFVSLIVLAILFPLVRSNWRDYMGLLGVVVSGLMFFILQLVRHLYLIVESDLETVSFEKVFIIGYILLLFLYVAYYFYFKSAAKNILFILPSLLVGGFMIYTFVDIIYLDKQLKFFHNLLEQYCALFFLWHTISAILLHMIGNWTDKSVRSFIGLFGMVVLSILGLWYYASMDYVEVIHKEHVFFFYNIILFFPLINASFLQLKFGKVSLVVTQTIQYLVSIVASIVLYLLIIQLFDYLQPSIHQYRDILEFVTFILLIVVVRLLYLANENKFRKYFVTPQQERLTKFKSFIARIPQYTSSDLLRRDLVEEMQTYFDAESLHLWWKGDEPTNPAEQRYSEQQESIYRQLTQHNAIWSRTKEIETFRLTQDLEKSVLKSSYTLLCPIKVDQENYALLMLGKKKRGVYNLTDIELISQLIQQTQLTLNVLQLNAREKELLQQTYEANLTALRSQINPHFLFNTLNSIGELVHESADLAEEAVEKLAFIFRYTLRMSDQNFVSLADEVSLISAYLDLEKVRFGERLNTHIEIDKEVKEVPVPSFIISTLVENCIKHGIAKILGKGIVSVEAFKEDNFLVVEVVDNGPGIDVTRIYKSTGLSNSIARLENIYELKNLLYFENTGEGTYVRLKIPLVDMPQLS